MDSWVLLLGEAEGLTDTGWKLSVTFSRPCFDSELVIVFQGHQVLVEVLLHGGSGMLLRYVCSSWVIWEVQASGPRGRKGCSYSESPRHPEPLRFFALYFLDVWAEDVLNALAWRQLRIVEDLSGWHLPGSTSKTTLLLKDSSWHHHGRLRIVISSGCKYWVDARRGSADGCLCLDPTCWALILSGLLSNGAESECRHWRHLEIVSVLILAVISAVMEGIVYWV